MGTMKYKIGDKVIIDNTRYGRDSVRNALIGLEGIIESYRDTKQIPLCEEEIKTGDIAMYRVFTPHSRERYNGTATYWEDELKLI